MVVRYININAVYVCDINICGTIYLFADLCIYKPLLNYLFFLIILSLLITRFSK